MHLVTKREYAEHGSVALGEGLRRRLKKEGREPYVIPVGGSDAVGTWGYVEMVEELNEQLRAAGGGGEGGGGIGGGGITDVVTACGSGGTSAGIALGCRLCPELHAPEVHAYGGAAPSYGFNTSTRSSIFNTSTSRASTANCAPERARSVRLKRTLGILFIPSSSESVKVRFMKPGSNLTFKLAQRDDDVSPRTAKSFMSAPYIFP